MSQTYFEGAQSYAEWYKRNEKTVKCAVCKNDMQISPHANENLDHICSLECFTVQRRMNGDFKCMNCFIIPVYTGSLCPICYQMNKEHRVMLD